MYLIDIMEGNPIDKIQHNGRLNLFTLNSYYIFQAITVIKYYYSLYIMQKMSKGVETKSSDKIGHSP